MRLITLYQNLVDSNNSLAQWESRLEDDFTIKPKSKLALINCNLKYNNNNITISNLNNEFSLFLTKANIDADNGTVCFVSPGKYNITSFTDEMQKAINAGITYDETKTTPPTLGLACKTFIDGGGLFNIQFQKSDSQQIYVTEATDAIDYASDSIERTSVIGSNNWNQYVELGWNDTTNGVQKIPICKGCFEFSIRLTSISSTKKFILGLVAGEIDFSLGIDLQPDRYITFISNFEDDNTYTINGFKTDIFAVNGDILTITLNNGIITYSKLSGTDLPDNSFDMRENLGALSDSFLYISLWGSQTSISFKPTNGSTQVFTYEPDPFYKASDENPAPNIRINMDFTRPDVNNDIWALLGYAQPLLTTAGINSTFTAINKLDFELAEDQGCNIIIDNLPLVSYNFNDSVSKKQPILYTVPSGVRDTLGVVSYSTSYPVPVNLNNQFELNIKNLRFSIRNAKNNAIESIDEAALSIALLDENE